MLLATAIWTGCGILVFLWMPLSSPGLLVLGTIAPVGWYVASKGSVPTLTPAATTLALLLAGVYLAVNASWSLSPADAHLALLTLFLFVVVLHLIHSALADGDPDVLRALLIALYAGMALGGLVLCFEVLSHQWIYRRLMAILPGLRPKDRDVIVAGGTLLLQPYLLNRSISALAFLFWPTMLMVALVRPQGARSQAWILALVPVVVAILASVHATSKIARLLQEDRSVYNLVQELTARIKQPR